MDDDSGTSAGGVSSKISNWERRARSLSPARKDTTAADKAGMAETQAQMAILADATNVVSHGNTRHPCLLPRKQESTAVLPRRGSESVNGGGG